PRSSTPASSTGRATTSRAPPTRSRWCSAGTSAGGSSPARTGARGDRAQGPDSGTPSQPMGAPSTNDERAPGEGFLVLWAGSAELVERDTQVELRRAGVRVEVAGVEELAARANERAPDLVVLGGEPGEDPEPVAAGLRKKSPAAAVPVVALAPHLAAAP